MTTGLRAISDRAWDNLGVLVGCLACGTIGYQVLHEWRAAAPSSVSIWFVAGFLFVYLFWFFYGIRFRRRGIWLPNAVAAILQVLFAVAVLAKATPAVAQSNDPNRQEWIQLFNGRDLSGWTAKFAKHELGENLNDTFRVESGILSVHYDRWTAFDGEFGHLFYKDPFSYYRLVAEYRFAGGQLSGGADWARRNNGLMIHCLDPRSMTKGQDFPISIEVQLLGGLGDGKPRPTANLCTPGTNVVMNGPLFTPHCVNSSSRTYDGDQWVRVEVEVHGDELIRHVVEGKTVLEYTKPQIGGGQVSVFDPRVKIDGTPLTGGYIAIQSETAPTDFRKIELLNLEGCADPKALNYKTYYVKSNPRLCRY